MVGRQRVLELLRNSKPELQARFGVTRLALRPELRPYIEQERVNV